MNKDLEVINGRVEVLFKNLPQTMYRINIVDDRFSQTYKFFMDIKSKDQKIKSMPLHVVKTYDLDYLEQLLNKLRKQTTLPFNFEGFQGKIWPCSKKSV